jgi:nucleotide-binding universal stress UspA family protein
MTRVLIAVDGSKCSIAALSYVVGRKRKGERIEAFVLNVQPPISPKVGLISRSMIKDYQDQESQKVLGQRELKAMIKYLRADVYVEVGNVAERIVKFASKTGCDEIVIGSRGLGGVKGFIGSVANKVVQLSTAPVIVVK